MKIDEVLARHPWPWTKKKVLWGCLIVDARGDYYMDSSAMFEDACDAFLELVAAHVARTATQATHSAYCWEWHIDCAVAMIRRSEAEMAELLAASSDILLSFTAGTECRIPHHQVERLFKAVHGKDARTPWEDDKEASHGS